MDTGADFGWLHNFIIEVLPLYFISLLGFIAGKFLKVDTKSVSTLAIYMFTPFVFCFSVAQLPFSLTALLMPLITFLISSTIALTMVNITKRASRDDKMPYLTGMASGDSNWGYFGIPIILSLYDASFLAAFIVIGFGSQIYQNTFGIYFISRGKYAPYESFRNIFKFPAFYAIFVGLTFSYLQLDFPDYVLKTVDLFKSSYAVLGMMIIGLGIASLDRFRMDFGFISLMFFIRFLLWPGIAFAIVALNLQYHIFEDEFNKPLLLFSIMPMAANNIAFAAQFDMNPGKVSVAVLLSTLFAVVYIPFAIYIFGI